jgi:membrane associated rhomboid family serine protease
VLIFNLRVLAIEWHLPPIAPPARPTMFRQDDPRDDYQPYGYLGGIPLYFTTLLIIAYAAFMVGIALCMAASVPPYWHYLIYRSDEIQAHYQFWRFFTYPLVNEVSIWFVVEIWFLYSFGREVERFIGRTAFAVIYLALVALAPCVLTAIALWHKEPFFLAGSQTPDFAVFIAFATIYPNAEILFSIKAKWLAAILVSVYSLQLLAVHDLVPLLVFWGTCLAAFVFIKYLRGQIQFSLRDYFRFRHSRQALRPMPSPRALPPRKPPAPRDNVIESIDPLLDKIATHGIASLTPREREKLEEARAELLKKPLP